jgi:hypothetical protein
VFGESRGIATDGGEAVHDVPQAFDIAAIEPAPSPNDEPLDGVAMGTGVAKELGPGSGAWLAAAPGPTVRLDRATDGQRAVRSNVGVADPLDERHQQIARPVTNQRVATCDETGQAPVRPADPSLGRDERRRAQTRLELHEAAEDVVTAGRRLPGGDRHLPHRVEPRPARDDHRPPLSKEAIGDQFQGQADLAAELA